MSGVESCAISTSGAVCIGDRPAAGTGASEEPDLQEVTAHGGGEGGGLACNNAANLKENACPKKV